MKNLFALLVIVVLAIFCSCQKPLTDEELQARIEREVKRQLAAEREAQEKELEQRRAQFNSVELGAALFKLLLLGLAFRG